MNNKTFSILIALVIGSIIILMAWASMPPKLIKVSGRVIAVQDSFWNSSFTTIQPTNGYAVRVRGVWGATNDQVRVRAREAQ